MTLISNSSKRSIEFNIVISAAFLSKGMIGYRIRQYASFRKLRQYIVYRLACDGIIVLPLILYYKFSSATAVTNYNIVIGILIASELGLLIWNFRKLYTKTIIEVMESIEES
jgi:hypothetical protein